MASPTKKALIILVNTFLVLLIGFLILAQWMPAIYTSEWFQKNHWTRVHMLHNQTP